MVRPAERSLGILDQQASVARHGSVEQGSWYGKENKRGHEMGGCGVFNVRIRVAGRVASSTVEG
jgi:hypothetical protein